MLVFLYPCHIQKPATWIGWNYYYACIYMLMMTLPHLVDFPNGMYERRKEERRKNVLPCSFILLTPLFGNSQPMRKAMYPQRENL